MKPTEDSPDYLRSKNLVALTSWVNLCHEDVFLLGPFDFATFTRKSRDRIGKQEWEHLAKLKMNRYDNQGPNMSEENTASFCVDVPFHSVHSTKRVARIVSCIVSVSEQETQEALNKADFQILLCSPDDVMR